MKRIILASCLSLLVPSVTHAAPQDKTSIQTLVDAEQRYEQCLSFAGKAPDRGIGMALEWQSDGGGVPARHCEAVGLFTLGEYREAAARFDRIASDARMGRGMPERGGKRLNPASTLISGLYGQAANAWLLAGYYSEAAESIEKAVALAEKGSDQYLEHLIDRARISAADDDYALALEDLQLVLVSMPGRPDVLVMAATAARAGGDVIMASNYLEQALEFQKDYAEALIERGHLHRQIGAPGLARTDWLKVIGLYPDTDAGERARTALEALEVAALKDTDPATADKAN